MDPQANPFAAFSLIVAPAILTNAASVLAMSTSNRLARAVDRARELSRQLEGAQPEEADRTRRSDWDRRFQELAVQEQRTTMLLRVLQSFYFALGGFASSTLAALLGAVLTRFGVGMLVMVFEFAAVAGGAIGVASLVRGSLLLVHETGIAVQIVSERAARVRARARVQ